MNTLLSHVITQCEFLAPHSSGWMEKRAQGEVEEEGEAEEEEKEEDREGSGGEKEGHMAYV